MVSISSLHRGVAHDIGCYKSRDFRDTKSDQCTVCAYPDNLSRFQRHIGLTSNFLAPIDSYFVVAYLPTRGYGDWYFGEGRANEIDEVCASAKALPVAPGDD